MEDLAKTLFSREVARFDRGSSVYGTYEPGVSDNDKLVVVDDSCAGLLSGFPGGIYQERDGIDDWQFICDSAFSGKVSENRIDMLECVFSNPGAAGGKYMENLHIDLWKLRTSVSSVSSNSWVKCKKKLTVEKDYDLRCGQKSLWHSLRLYMFGIQIAKTGGIRDFGEANPLWYDIRDAENPVWEYYEAKYKALHNSLRSEMVKLCGRPEEVKNS